MRRYEVILVVALVLVLFLPRLLVNGVKDLKNQPQEVRFFLFGLALILGSILIFVSFYALKHAG